jgi:hypothetical protein
MRLLRIDTERRGEKRAYDRADENAPIHHQVTSSTDNLPILPAARVNPRMAAVGRSATLLRHLNQWLSSI